MAAPRNKNQATRKGGRQGTPGWVWLVAGLVLGAAGLFILPGLLKQEGDGFFRPQPNPDALPAQVVEADDAGTDTPPAADQGADGAARETSYDFYTLLPGKEVQITDAELAASARAEQASQASAPQPPAAAAVDAAAAGPEPVVETGADAASASTPPAAEPAAASDARYILQAGAFGGSGDAEAAKAKIALLGLSARVESAQINGKTVYRVRMGPYGTASELAEAKQKLASGGLPAMAIRAR